MLTILTGPPSSGKTGQIMTEMAARAAQGRRSLLLTPESGSHQLERRLLECCGNRAARFAEVSTFSKLTEAIFDAAGVAPRSLDAGGRVLTMYRALVRCGESLTYYRGASRPDLLRRLLEMTEELKAGGVTPEEFMAAAQGERLHDLALIYAAYCALCAEGRMDPTDRLSRAAELLPGLGMLRETAVYIDGFDLFTGQKYAAVEALLRAGESLTVALQLDDDGQLYKEQYHARARLRAAARRVGSPCRELALPAPEDGRPAALNYLSRRLLDYAALPTEDAQGVELYTAKNPEEESELAAALMRDAMLNGVRLRECAVVCGDMTEYGPLLERSFARYGVPLFLSTRESILRKPALQAALGGLRALEGGLMPEDVLDWLKTGLCGLQPEEVDELENYVLRWNISGARWKAPFTLPTCGYDLPEPDEEQRLALVEELRGRVMRLLTPLEDELRLCRTGGAFAQALERHWEAMALEDGLAARTDQLTALGLRRQAAEYAQLWNILTDGLEQFAGALEEEPLDRADCLRLLRLLLAQYDVSAIPVSLDAVQAVTLERMALGPLKRLILLGGREGLLPADKHPDSLLSERDRIALETAGVELSQSEEERAFQQQLAVVRAFAAPSERLTAVRPLRNADGGEYRESYVLRRVRRLLPGLEMQEAGTALARLRLEAQEPLWDIACAAAGTEGRTPVQQAVLAHCRAENGLFLDLLRAYAAGPRGPIPSAEVVAKLYGAPLHLTASRLELLSTCRFSYFMQYGLKAKPRREADVGAPEAGTFVHEVVEKAVRDLCEGRETDPHAAAARRAAEYIAALPHGDSRRQDHQLRSIARLAGDVTANAWEEIQSGDFRPQSFELGFGGHGALPPLTLGEGDRAVEITGKIDRVDVWHQPEGDYVKVVDYKTGKKTFRLCDVMEGVNLQMFLYLLALERAPEDRRAEAGIGPMQSAAALYLPAKAPFVAAGPDTDEQEVREKLDKELRRIGLVVGEENILHALDRVGSYRFLPLKKTKSGFGAGSCVAEPAELDRLLRLTERKVHEAAALVRAGDVEAHPYMDGTRSVCDWCPYRTACHFDPTMRRDRMRRRKYMKDAEVHEALRQAEEEGAL